MKRYQKKKKNLELVAAHITLDMIPKAIPKYNFNLPIDESSLTTEQAQNNRKEIEKISKEFSPSGTHE